MYFVVSAVVFFLNSMVPSNDCAMAAKPVKLTSVSRIRDFRSGCFILLLFLKFAKVTVFCYSVYSYQLLFHTFNMLVASSIRAFLRMNENKVTGNKGEQRAIDFLKEQGHTILESNWQYQHVEIDIISLHQNILVVTEVKTRRSNFFGEPEEWVTRQKQRNLIKAAAAYLKKYDLDLEVRFDIISILINK